MPGSGTALRSISYYEALAYVRRFLGLIHGGHRVVFHGDLTVALGVLVICGGAIPATAPLQELSWAEFAAPWEADVRMSFLFCGHVLRTPLAPGSRVILISSGAGLRGSPISGGYAGSKRMQMFMAAYCQKESVRLGLGIHFTALVPMRIMPETELGETAVKGYAHYLGIAPADFIQGISVVRAGHGAWRGFSARHWTHGLAGKCCRALALRARSSDVGVTASTRIERLISALCDDPPVIRLSCSLICKPCSRQRCLPTARSEYSQPRKTASA